MAGVVPMVIEALEAIGQAGAGAGAAAAGVAEAAHQFGEARRAFAGSGKRRRSLPQQRRVVARARGPELRAPARPAARRVTFARMPRRYRRGRFRRRFRRRYGKRRARSRGGSRIVRRGGRYGSTRWKNKRILRVGRTRRLRTVRPTGITVLLPYVAYNHVVIPAGTAGSATTPQAFNANATAYFGHNKKGTSNSFTDHVHQWSIYDIFGGDPASLIAGYEGRDVQPL